jgi:ribosomal protein S18 acetylase RimI-like enzyme
MARSTVIQGYFSGRTVRLATAGPVQRHAAPGGGDAFQLPQHLTNFANGGGQPLPPDVRMKMESFFGTSFGDVRVHVGPQAASIGALAFTQGSDIHFAPGQYNPSSPQGQQILGHELAHVVQQRSGRVRNPFGGGIAVVQDRSLEAEADRLGQRAATHQVQAKMRATAVQRSAPVRVSQPVKTNGDSYRIAASAGGESIGAVTIHPRDNSILVTDLGVDPDHRSEGVGNALLASAARAGMQLGKSKVVLDSQDNGSGHLTQWYKRMGFVQTGVGRNGMPHLEAPANRVLTGAAQAKMPNNAAPRCNAPHQHDAVCGARRR